MIVTDVYPGKDFGTLELTITVFWSCRVFSKRRAANQPTAGENVTATKHGFEPLSTAK